MTEGLDIKQTIAVVLALALCVLPLYVIGTKNKALGLGVAIPVGAALLYALLNLLGL